MDEIETRAARLIEGFRRDLGREPGPATVKWIREVVVANMIEDGEFEKTGITCIRCYDERAQTKLVKLTGDSDYGRLYCPAKHGLVFHRTDDLPRRAR